MKKIKIISILIMICLLASLVFAMTTNKVYASTKNEVTLNFEGGIIHDGYVEYSKIAKLQLFKGDELVVNISNNMVIDLNEAEYKFVIEEIEDTSVSGANTSIKLKINKWYYPMTKIEGEAKSTFKLDSGKFNDTLDVEFERRNIAFNTTIKNIYNDISSKGVIDLTNGQEYIIDFSKTDELTEGLKSFADLDKTLYYKRDNKGLLATDNESEAVIKIVGNKSENKAILTAVNVGTKKSEVFKGLHTKYTGASLKYDGSDGGILNETRTDYYTRCTYEFTFKYVNEETKENEDPKQPEKKEYKFIEGANQTYTIDNSKNAKFRIDADYSLFENKVYVDDKLVDTKNYDSESGSTIITLKEKYLKTLSVGKHTLKVTFSNGGEAVTKFEIKAKQTNTKAETNKKENNNNVDDKNEEEKEITNNNSSNPKTGDNIYLYGAIFIASIVGMIIVSVVRKRK